MIPINRITGGLMRYLPLTPAIFLAVLIPRYWVDLPQYDEWDSVAFFEHLSQGSLTASLLFKQANEYRQFFPNIIIVAVGWLTRWDIRYDMVLIFVAACLISLFVWRLATHTVQDGPLRFAVLIFLGNLIIFSPTQYENWLQGQQLVYYMPILCVTAGILVAQSNLAILNRFVICAGLSVISMFSSANGVVCWIVILPMLLVTGWKTNRRLVIWLSLGWIAGLGLCLALYLHGYQKPWWTPSPLTAFDHPLKACIYFLGFVGGPFGLERVRLSLTAGIVLMIGFIWSVVYVIKHRCDRVLIENTIGWLVIGSYSVLTAAMTTVGRVGLPTGPSQVPRYLGFSAYLPLALVFLAHVISSDMDRRKPPKQINRWPPLTVTAAIILILFQPFMCFLSLHQMQKWQTRLQQAKASIVLINGLPDMWLTKNLYPNLQFLTEKANALNRLGFLRPKLVQDRHLKNFSGALQDEKNYGVIESLQKSGEHQYVAAGWAVLPTQQKMPDAVILAYDTGDGDAIAFQLTHPLRTESSVHAGNEIGSWNTSFSTNQLPKVPVSITAWAFDVSSGKAFRLSGGGLIDGS
ncbi:MAG: hypothetical protein ABR607_00500 [Pyrinomonadaceae bacterium]